MKSTLKRHTVANPMLYCSPSLWAFFKDMERGEKKNTSYSVRIENHTLAPKDSQFSKRELRPIPGKTMCVNKRAESQEQGWPSCKTWSYYLIAM